MISKYAGQVMQKEWTSGLIGISVNKMRKSENKEKIKTTNYSGCAVWGTQPLFASIQSQHLFTKNLHHERDYVLTQKPIPYIYKR